MRRIAITDEHEWKRVRREHLQASDAAVCCGISPWKTVDRLFDEKTGAVPEKDISGKPCVVRGKNAEEHIRKLVAIDLPDCKVDYHRYDIIECSEPGLFFMGATLDGELTDQRGERAVLEIKTGSFRNADDLALWDGQIPAHYLAQVTHQLVCTGWPYAIVAARLTRDGFRESDRGLPEVIWRYYRIGASDPEFRGNRDYIVGAELSVWGCIQKHERPTSSATLKF